MEPEEFLRAEPSHSWSGCNMHSRLEGSCSTCKNKEHIVTMWGWHQSHNKRRTSILPCLCCAKLTADQFGRICPPYPCLIRDKDHFSREKLVAWEHLWMAAVFCWVSIMGMCPRRSVQLPLWQAGWWGVRGVTREQLTGFCWEFSSAGLQSLWLRSCSTA